MTRTDQQKIRGPGVLGRLSPQLLKTPLAYILADHRRQRALFDLCDDLADALAYEPTIAKEVADFIADAMSLHVQDEEEDLFPLLRRRALDEDKIEPTIGLLRGDHAADQTFASQIERDLRTCVARNCETLEQPLRNALRTFADRQRRHLAIENAIVLPLAQRRLTASDLECLGNRMAARRGIAL